MLTTDFFDSVALPGQRGDIFDQVVSGARYRSDWLGMFLFVCLPLLLAFLVALLFRSFRMRLSSILLGLFLLRRIKGGLLAGYLTCASYAALDLPWQKQGSLAWQSDRPLGFHFVWEYGNMGLGAHAVYGLVVVEQLGILLAFAAAYKLVAFVSDVLT